MMSVSFDGFFEAARKGVVTVEFNKVSTGELRVMPCTLSYELSNKMVPESLEHLEESATLAVWCVDKNAWRSFRKDSVQRWYEGYPAEQKESA